MSKKRTWSPLSLAAVEDLYVCITRSCRRRNVKRAKRTRTHFNPFPIKSHHSSMNMKFVSFFRCKATRYVPVSGGEWKAENSQEIYIMTSRLHGRGGVECSRRAVSLNQLSPWIRMNMNPLIEHAEHLYKLAEIEGFLGYDFLIIWLQTCEVSRPLWLIISYML